MLKLPADAQGNLPNCGLTAMAVAANVTLKEATEAYQKACVDLRGRRMTGNWKGRTFSSVRDRAMTEYLGMKLSRLPIHGYSLKKMLTFLEEDVKYIITTTGHVQVVQNRLVVDQDGVCDIDNYWGKRKKVKNILVVEG